MKKLFFIFFVFFFSLKAHAIVLKNCYVSERDNKSVDTSFREDQFEKFEFKVFSEGKIRRTQIATDEFFKEVKKNNEAFRKKEKEKYGNDIGPSTVEKIHTTIFKITFFDEKYIKAERSDTITTDLWSVTKINLNLKDGSVLQNYVSNYLDRTILNEATLYKCEVSKTSSKSNYLDYWWAVILIIAITFFIFTQSGKRLKRIRRK